MTQTKVSDTVATRILTYENAAPYLSWPGAIDALRAGHRLPRPELGDLILGPKHALLLNRAAYIEGLGYAVKAETWIPENTSIGLPAVQGAVLLYNASTGTVRAILEGKLVTAYKTAADSVLAATMLARPNSRTLVIAGAGTVAKTLVRAYSAAFPALERIVIWARRAVQAEALVASMQDVGIELVSTHDLRVAVQQADIVASATMATEPLLLGDWIRPGTHVDLIGGFTPTMREADDSLMAKAKIFVDFRHTTIDCVGDLTQPIASGAIARGAVCGDLYDIVHMAAPLRASAEDITVFKNGGGAHLDLMIADYIHRAFH
jgi:ornithine cyclodeaminase/alanine dehydrogenase-like protein (mu-crystallin family)